MRSTGGFTLIELMMVVVIVAVLAAIAYPSYISSVVKANRAEAQSYLMDVAQQQQQFFNDTRRYAIDEDDLKVPVPNRVDAVYSIGFAVDPNDIPPEFTVTATPKSGTSQAGDGVLSVDNTGEKLRDGEAW